MLLDQQGAGFNLSLTGAKTHASAAFTRVLTSVALSVVAGPYLQVVVVHLAVGLVVVWVVHLIQEIDGEPPGQTGLGHKDMLPQTRRVNTLTNKQQILSPRQTKWTLEAFT